MQSLTIQHRDLKATHIAALLMTTFLIPRSCFFLPFVVLSNSAARFYILGMAFISRESLAVVVVVVEQD